MTTFHKNLTGADLHAINTWSYADAASRGNASGFVVEDKGKIAWQQDNNTFWVLINHSPITWQALGAVNPLMESIIPDMTGGSGDVSAINIGSPTKKINSIYTSELFLDASSLYVNEKKVIEDDSGTIVVSTDVDEDLQLKTSGGGDVRLTSENEVNLNASGGVEVVVPSDNPTKHINISNSSAGGNMTFYATGVGAQTQFYATDEIDLTAPTIDLNGDVDISGDLTIQDNSINKSAVGLGNVPNLDFSDASNITSGTLPSSVIPPIAITSVHTAINEAAQLTLTVEEGDVVVRTDENKSYIHNGGSAGDMTDWQELKTPTDSVLSVNSKTGSVILNQDDVGDGTTYVRTENNFTDILLSKLTAVEAGATGDQTASEILTLLKTVDGSDSDLDADLLDGQEGSYYAAASVLTEHLNSNGHITESTLLTDSDDLDNLTDGVYMWMGTAPLNAPNNYLVMVQVTENQKTQMAFGASSTGELYIRRADGGTFYSWTRFVTENNLLSLIKSIDGSGSGIDADLLDGYNASSFLRSNANDTYTGALTVAGSITFGSGVKLQESSDRSDLLRITSQTSSYGGIQIENSSLETLASFMTDGSTIGIYDDQQNEWVWSYVENAGHNFRYNGSTALSITGTASATLGGNTVWHAGNDGAGSGLDADKLDGRQMSESSTADTIVSRNGSGDINARLFRSEYDTTNASINYIMTQVDTASNNYIRPSTPAQFRAAVTDGHYLTSSSGANAVTLKGTRTATGTWTLTGLSIGVPLIIGFRDTDGGDGRYATFRITSGANIAMGLSNINCFSIGQDAGRSDGNSGSTVTVPTATSVSIYFETILGGTVYAYQ